MSGDNNGHGGRTLGGGDPEPLPEGWGSSSAPRVGRIGGTSRCARFHVGLLCLAESTSAPDDVLHVNKSNHAEQWWAHSVTARPRQLRTRPSTPSS
jgi:hypothetical protein